MRLKIFWRVILAQPILIILILMVSLYALSQLNWLTHLNTNILTIDASVIEAEKQLPGTFLSQMRHNELIRMRETDIAHTEAFAEIDLRIDQKERELLR